MIAVSYAPTADLSELEATTRSLMARVTGGSEAQPLNGLVTTGQTVVIKPNMVRHFNPGGPLSAVVTSPALVRVLATIAFEAVGSSGQVVVADSPQNDCDFSTLLAEPSWREVRNWADQTLGAAFKILDMRPEEVIMRDGVVVIRRPLPGDPKGEALIDLGDNSAFIDSGIAPARLRGSEYDPSVTRSSHSGGLHQYSVCRTFVEADLLFVVPKVKTHKKVGLSLAMKNLVGMVGEKNCLPHYTAGFPNQGGDEYEQRTLRTAARHWGVEHARRFLAEGRGVKTLRAIRKFERTAMPEVVSRSGNWWGNDTAWRMVVDLVTILRMARRDRSLPTLFVYDGQVAGQGDGPLAPTPMNLGLLAVADDPVAGDTAVARELGLDPDSMPLLREAVARRCWGSPASGTPFVYRLSASSSPTAFQLHPGWVRLKDSAGSL